MMDNLNIFTALHARGPAVAELGRSATMQMRKLKAFLFAAIAALLAYAGWHLFVRDSNRSFFVEHSGIHIPFGVTNTIHFTAFEFAMSSHYSLPSKARATFVQTNPFTTLRPKDWKPIFHLADLPVPWNEVPTSGTLYYLTGADSFTAWDAVFHLESGSLWTSIYYADSSGDLPPRARPTPPHHALQRTGAPAPAPAADHRRLSTHRQVPRPLRLSLSLGSLGD